MNWFAGLFFGLPLALLTLLVAAAMTGAGHGWITPFFYSLAAVVMAPVAIAALSAKTSRSLTVPIIVSLIGVVLDVLVYWSTLDEGIEYFHRVGGIAGFWIALWAAWQLCALATIARRSLTRPD